MRRLYCMMLTLTVLCILPSCKPLQQTILDKAAEQSQSIFIVWVSGDADKSDRQLLEDSLNTMSNVRSVKYISKEDMLQQYADAIPEDTFDALQGENNPMLDAFYVTVIDASLMSETVSEVQSLPHVDEVSYTQEFADILTSISF